MSEDIEIDVNSEKIFEKDDENTQTPILMDEKESEGKISDIDINKNSQNDEKLGENENHNHLENEHNTNDENLSHYLIDDNSDEIDKEEEEEEEEEENISENHHSQLRTAPTASSFMEGTTKVTSEYSDSDDFPSEYKHIPISSIIRGAQEILLWRRPFTLFFVVLITEVLFYAIYKLNLDTFSTICLSLIFTHCVCLIYSILPKAVQMWVFPPIDEIKVDDKVRNFFIVLKERAAEVKDSIIKHIKHPTVGDSILFIGTPILLFIIFLIVGSFWSSFIAVNSLFFATRK